MLTRIALYRLTRRGKRGWLLTLPARWVNAQNLQASTVMDVLTDDEGNLVIRQAKGEEK